MIEAVSQLNSETTLARPIIQKIPGYFDCTWYPDDESYAAFLTHTFGSDYLERHFAWNGRARSLMQEDESPYAACLPLPLQKDAAQYAPWPVVYLAGTLRESWRDDLVPIVRKNGLIPAWVGQIDDEAWQKHQTFYEAAFLIHVWGADALIIHLKNAGEYSHREYEFAQLVGIPSYTTDDFENAAVLVNHIKQEHPPWQVLPRGNAALWEHSTLITQMANNYSGCEPLNLYPEVNAILSRRRGRMPWDELKSQ